MRAIARNTCILALLVAPIEPSMAGESNITKYRSSNSVFYRIDFEGKRNSTSYHKWTGAMLYRCTDPTHS